MFIGKFIKQKLWLRKVIKMASPANKKLVRQLHDFLNEKEYIINIPSILNIGAG